MFLKGWLSKIGAVITAVAAVWPVIQDGVNQVGDGSKVGLISGLLVMVLGVIRKLETIEKK